MLDSRVRYVLTALASKGGPKFGEQIINPNTCATAVVGATLRQARIAGLAEYQMVKNKRLWQLTDAGREAIRS